MNIEVCKRLGDWKPVFENGVQTGTRHTYHAQLKGNPGIWATGDTMDEAIGNLIHSHSEKFKVTINFIGKQAR